MDFIVISLLAAAVLLFAWHTWWPSTPIDKSIAVLAFADMSTEGDQEYLADGVAEELTNLLAKIPELRVTSRSSAFAFKSEKIDIPAIAKSLGVAYVLEGSLRKAGNQLRITTQLIEARSDTHVWSETYDRSMDDIFAIQDEIAAAVVDQLRISLLGELPTPRQVDPEAYRLYLLANYVSGPGSDSTELQNAEVLYKQALAIDPNFARAWRKLALLYFELHLDGVLTADEAYSLQVDALEKAISIDPANSRIYTNLGILELNYSRDFEKAAQHFRHAISLDPYDLTVLNNSALFLLVLGRVEEAIPVYEYLIAQYPRNTYALLNYARLSVFAGYPDQAIAAGEAFLALRPGAGWIRSVMGDAYRMKGEAEKALELYQDDPDRSEALFGEVLAYYDMGNLDASDASLDTFMQEYGRTWPFGMALLFAYRNEADLAFEWIETALRDGNFGINQNLASPLFANIRTDPRWLPITERLNMSPAELEAIDFKITLPE